MSEIQSAVRDFYASQGLLSDPGSFADQFTGLPDELFDLCKVVQGLVLHPAWAERSGVTPDEAHMAEQQRRSVPEILMRFPEDGMPLSEARPPEGRTIGTCRTFSLLLCAMLRHQGVPARARCGFATYFEPGRYVDHWVCEYWHTLEQRWSRVDAQLDGLQRRTLAVSFNPLDVPDDQFVTGGEAWQLCRAGVADLDSFGIFDMRGLWFVRGNVVRDLAALNKIEMLPWDAWGLVDRPEDELSAQDRTLVNRAAELGSTPSASLNELQNLYEANESLRVPREIRSYSATGVQTIVLPEALAAV